MYVWVVCVREYFCKRVLFECVNSVNWKQNVSLHLHMLECLFAATLYVLVLFALSLVNYYDFLYFFAWSLNDAYSVLFHVLFHLLCFRLFFHLFCSYKNLLQIPCRSQEKREFTIFLLVCLSFWANHLEQCVSFSPFLYRHLLGDYLFLLIIFFS